MNLPELKTIRDYIDAIDFMISTKDQQLSDLEAERADLVRIRREAARQLQETLQVPRRNQT